MPSDEPTENQLKRVIVDLRSRGWKPITVNGAIRSSNAYLKWSGSTAKLANLKEEQRARPTFSLDDIRKLQLWRPTAWIDKRLQVLVLLLCDSAARVREVLQLKWSDVNLDDCLMTLHGKGQKDRIIPFGVELRRALFKWRPGEQVRIRSIDSGTQWDAEPLQLSQGLLSRCVKLGI